MCVCVCCVCVCVCVCVIRCLLEGAHCTFYKISRPENESENGLKQSMIIS